MRSIPSLSFHHLFLIISWKPFQRYANILNTCVCAFIFFFHPYEINGGPQHISSSNSTPFAESPIQMLLEFQPCPQSVLNYILIASDITISLMFSTILALLADFGWPGLGAYLTDSRPALSFLTHLQTVEKTFDYHHKQHIYQYKCPLNLCQEKCKS